MTRGRRILLFIVTLPFTVGLIAFQVLLVPFLLFVAPLWALLDLINVIKGERSELLSMFAEVFLLPFTIWLEMVGLEKPAWLRRIMP